MPSVARTLLSAAFDLAGDDPTPKGLRKNRRRGSFERGLPSRAISLLKTMYGRGLKPRPFKAQPPMSTSFCKVPGSEDFEDFSAEHLD